MNVTLDQLQPGVFGVSHGGGIAGELIRHATGSWAGHAFIYIGNGMIVSGQPPRAVKEPATTYPEAVWAWRMWDQLRTEGWTNDQVASATIKVVSRAIALVGCSYDFEAYAGFALEVLNLRNGKELEPWFRQDGYRVCSALVADAEIFGGVPLDFVPEDGPGLAGGGKVAMPVNLVAPGMLLGLAQRKEWL